MDSKRFLTCSRMAGGVLGWALCAGLAISLPAAAAATATEIPAGLRAAVGQSLRSIDATGAGHYVAQNPENRLMLDFDGRGLDVAPGGNASGWHWRLQLTGYGTPGQVQPVAPAEAVAAKQRVEYRRGPVTEWYENQPEGLEQGFTLARPPQPGAERIELRLHSGGDLEAKADRGGLGARLCNRAGQAVLEYRDLSVVDARGRPLPAQLVVAGGELAIRADTQGAVWPIVVDPLIVTVEQKLEAQNAGGSVDAEAKARYGYSVSLSADGATALVGAQWATVSGLREAGAAYVYTRNGTAWSIQRKLTAQTTAGGDDAEAKASFGYSVALSGDGNTALVGAKDATVSGLLGAGAAYVYVRNGTNWSIQRKLTAQTTAGGDDAVESAGFGMSAALSGDGSLALVGAANATASDVLGAGAAYVYSRSGTDWAIQRKLTAQNRNGSSDAARGAYFGNSAALSSDGSTALVGAPFATVYGLDQAGAAYIYGRSGTAWSIRDKLSAATNSGSDEEAGAWFGYSAALSRDGGTALLGAVFATADGVATAGAAYLYDRSETPWGTFWLANPKLAAQNAGGGSDAAAQAAFGYSVGLAGDGYTALVGASRATASEVPGAGAAYVYTTRGQGWGWEFQQKMTAKKSDGGDDAETGAFFGASAALSGDGGTALLGAASATASGVAKAGAAYAYSLYSELSVAATAGGRVTSSPAGIDCNGANTCTAEYRNGSTVTLTAVPQEHYLFSEWSGCAASSGASCTVTLSGDRSVTATFALKRYNLDVTVQTGGKVTVSPPGYDCTGPMTCGFFLQYNDTVTLTAQPQTGYAFSGWTGCSASSGNTCSVTVTGDKTVNANFAPAPTPPPGTYLLNVATTVDGQASGAGGVVSSQPGGINCGSQCSANLARGSAVTLTATPAYGYRFAGWSGVNCPGTGACTMTMDANKSVRANFLSDQSVYELRVSVSGTGSASGRITSAPAGIDCGTVCEGQFPAGSAVYLTAKPKVGSMFRGWSHCDLVQNDRSCLVSMTGAKDVVALFQRTSVATPAPTAQPSPAPAATSVPAPTIAPTPVATANPAPTAAPTPAPTVQPTPVPTPGPTVKQAALSVVTVGEGAVSSSAGGIDCGPVCSASYEVGSAVTLRAEPAEGYKFKRWIGGGCGAVGKKPCTVKLNQSKTVTAKFVKKK